MKMTILKNVSDKDITEYPMAEPDLGNEGQVRFDDNGNIVSTGETLLWSLKSGETKAFPEYVANHLLKIYGQTDPTATNQILEVVEDTEEKVEDVKPEVSGQLVCRHCGQSFKNSKGLGLHLSFKHLKEIL
jgi:hypothetical protein